MNPKEIGSNFLLSGIDIPEPHLMEGWKSFPIEECHQPLVSLNNLEGSHSIKVLPMYSKLGIQQASTQLYLRQEATDRLIQASKNLPAGYSFVIFDSYRPIVVQQEIFSRFKDELRKSHQEINENELNSMTEVYVSLPSRDPLKPSPHSTGGAIDLSIANEKQELLEMGADWDSFDIKSQTAYFRLLNGTYHQNRRLLYQLMTGVGYTNYPEEWWHYDFGNQFWARIVTRTAIYGLAQGGEII